jgi:hypothetical protein
MSKVKQAKKAADDGYTAEDNRPPKESSIERDKERGFDHQAGTQNGVSKQHAMWDTPTAKNAELIYVKAADGKFTFSPRPKTDLNQRGGGSTLPHSMLGKGEPVIGAGECETDSEGKIKRADNFSGHYQPNEKNLKKTKENMEKQGLAAQGAKFQVFDKSGQVIKGL